MIISSSVRTFFEALVLKVTQNIFDTPLSATPIKLRARIPTTRYRSYRCYDSCTFHLWQSKEAAQSFHPLSSRRTCSSMFRLRKRGRKAVQIWDSAAPSDTKLAHDLDSYRNTSSRVLANHIKIDPVIKVRFFWIFACSTRVFRLPMQGVPQPGHN